MSEMSACHRVLKVSLRNLLFWFCTETMFLLWWCTATGHWLTRSRDATYERQYSTKWKQNKLSAKATQIQSGLNYGAIAPRRTSKGFHFFLNLFSFVFHIINRIRFQLQMYVLYKWWFIKWCTYMYVSCMYFVENMKMILNSGWSSIGRKLRRGLGRVG